ADPYVANGMFPAWSPDGTTIAFQTERWIGGPFLYMVATRLADGSGSLTVHFNSYPTGMMPSPIAAVDWSPDGQMIAFERWSAESVFPHRIQRVHVVSHAFGQLVSEATSGVVQPYWDSDIAWSRVAP
ncbi:MAG TPA: hypothetical protein VFU85_01850, partial [Nocardioides sp.]|nr:hypothetical protein [Nocardioides sp.]